jgi:predicted transcriptional regulator
VDYSTEIRALLRRYTQQEVANMLGVSLRSVQNYVAEESPKKPSKEVSRKIHEVHKELFENEHTGHLKKALETKVEEPKSIYIKRIPLNKEQDYKDKYIALLEERLQEQGQIIDRLKTVEQHLSEAKRNQEIMYALQVGFQEYSIEYFAKQGRSKVEVVQQRIGEIAASVLRKTQQEGMSLT